jgi:aldehyde dehydrogenase (NAD+)
MTDMKDIGTYRAWIGGEWRDSSTGEWLDSVNPADTQDVVARFPNLTAADATQAVQAAASAFPDWSATAPTKRAEILWKAASLLDARREQYATELTREEGKVYSAALGEVKRAADTLRFYAQEGLSFTGETFSTDDTRSFVFTQREPLGVVSVITPWNFPISIPARKIAPALITGNTVVFKPASDTPLIAYRLVECLIEAGLPSGVINLVTGHASRVSSAIVRDPSVRAVTFTGSTAAGEVIHRSVSLTTRLQMELGGKNPIVVLDDANIERAVELTIKGGLELTGQACTGTSRAIVLRPVYDAFVEALCVAAAGLRIGNGLMPDVDIGPLANASQLETVLQYVSIGKQEGARLVFGGERLLGAPHYRGYFVRPAIFADVKPTMRIAQEEIFGPVISVIPVDSFDEALAIANDVEYGLSASIVTNNIERATRFIKGVQAGTVKVNRTTTGNLIQAPFGGYKRSSASTFRESGRVGLEFFTQLKTVYYGFG